MDSHICPKCQQTYTINNPPKQLITCQHTLCLECLKLEIVCPLDRKRIERRKYTIEAFQNNQTILAEIVKAMEISKTKGNQSNKSKSYSAKNSGKNSSSSQSNKANVDRISEKDKITPFQAVTSKIEQKENNIIYGINKANQAGKQITVTDEPKKQSTPTIISEKNKIVSPKLQKIQFQMCLLHSKRADLICLQDTCLICTNCGLFGQHRHHPIIQFDQFLTNYSSMTEQCLKTYQSLQQRENKLSMDVVKSELEQLMGIKREKEVRNIKNAINGLIDQLRKYEKEMISNLDLVLAYKQGKIGDQVNFKELIDKKEEYMKSVIKMSNGIEEVLNFQNLHEYIPYIDENSSSGFIHKEGEYLVLEIDNYFRNVQKKIESEINEFTIIFNPVNDMFKDVAKFDSKDGKEIKIIVQENRKKIQNKAQTNKINTPNRPKLVNTIKLNHKMSTPLLLKNGEDDPLLIGTNSKSGSKQSPNANNQKQKTNISPILPVGEFEYQINPPFIHTVKDHNIFDGDNYLRITEMPMGSSSNHYPNPNRKVSYNRSTVLPSQHRQSQNRKQNDEGYSIRNNNKSKPKSNNNSSNYATERELLNVLGEKSQNKKKRKLDLPQKYTKIYQDLQKDKLDVLDLGGAFLGDSTIITISQLLPSRGKLKSIKLMNNKISDEAFPQLLSRCHNLHSLNLSYNNLTQKSLDWLQQQSYNLGQLKNITISNNKIVLRNVKDRLQELRKRDIKVSL